MLLGSAILGAVAAGDQPSVFAAMTAMSRAARVVEPAGGNVQDYHARKYRVFLAMHEQQVSWRAIMTMEAGSP